jgi:opacity protein-like surface antigen
MHQDLNPSRPLIMLFMLLSSVPPALTLDGWYGAAGGGKAWFADDAFQGAISGPVTQSFAGEFGISGAIGYVFPRNPLRLEGEFCAFRANVDELRNTLTTFKGGSDRHLTGMLNLYYERAPRGRTKPYVGAGIGLDVEKWGLYLITPSGVSTAGRYDTEPFFAYQVKAGVAHALTKRLDFVAGYRYFRTQKRELDSPSAQVSYQHSAQAIHLLEFGLRWDW